MVSSDGSILMVSKNTRDRVSSWSHLTNLIERTRHEKWIFRGEPSNKFELRPKAGRPKTLRVRYDQEHEKRALQRFKRQARPYLGHSPASDLEWLAIAQHHGMTTRLLDWTESLLVAAYFAVEEAGTSGDAVIYGIRDLSTVSKSNEEHPFRLRRPAIYRPPHITPRIPAQRSVFTVHPDPTSLFRPSGLIRWTVPSGVCATIKQCLDACGKSVV